MKMEVETGVTQGQATERQRPPEAGRGKNGIFPMASERSRALPTPRFWDSGLRSAS